MFHIPRFCRREKKTRDPERIPRHVYVFLGLALAALLLYLIGGAAPRFSNAYNQTVGAAVRGLLAHLTSWIPFSLAEILIYLLPVLLVGICVYGVRRRAGSWRSTLVFLLAIVADFSLLFSLFTFGFGMGYRTETLDVRLGIPEEPVTTEELTDTALLLAERVNQLADGVSFGEDGFSVMPYDLRGMNDRLLEAYARVSEDYPFIRNLSSRVKPVLASRLMSYTHITGVYTYFTGEANLNVHFPDYTLPYTAAHELAHQRGIARENEANFVAFLVTAASDDPYLNYTAYLNLFEYVSSALYKVDIDRYREALRALDSRVYGELLAYSEFFAPYRGSGASKVSDAVNDAYLKLHGSAAGTGSYGLVVDLAVAYFRDELPD